MKLLSKTAWRKITQAISRVCPKISQRTGGFDLEAMEGRALLSTVGLDPHFGTGGTALGDFGGSDQGYAMVVQNDGKILMAGRAWNVDQYDFGVVRFNADGTLDDTFGTGGMVMTDVGSMFDSAYAMAVQTNGKIVVVGQTEGVGYDFGMVRYNTDGSLDTNFGNGGKVVTDFAGSYDIAYGVVVHASGKITLAGTATDANFHFRFGLAQYNSNGTLDTTFGTNGQVMTAFDGLDTEAYTLMAGNGGSFVVGGYAYNFDTGTTDVAMARYQSDGSLDTSFDGDGMVVSDLGMGDESIRALTMGGDGSIFGAGNGGGDYLVVKYSPSGQLDTSFGSGGKVFADFVGGYDVAHAIAVSGDKIMVAGTADMIGQTDIGVLSLHADGSADADFCNCGKLTLDLGSWDDEAMGMVVENNGNMLLGGFTVNPRGDYDYAVVHYGTFVDDTNLPPVADPGGPYSVSEGGVVELSGAASHDADGSIVSYEWDLNYDGNSFDVDATGVSVLFSASSLDGPLSRMVALRVTDNKGGCHIATAMVSVTNVNPTVNAGDDMTVNEGSSVDLSAVVSDPGLADTHTYLWHVSASNGQVIADGTGTHLIFTPADNGVYTVTVTVTDDDGGVGSDTVVVTALNVAPTVNAGDDQTVNEGRMVTLRGSFTDPGNDSYSLLWHVVASNGQVVGDGHGSSFEFTPLDNGIYTVTFSVTDKDGGVGSDQAVVTVLNVAPTADAGIDRTVNEGSLVSLAGTHSDAGTLDTVSCLWHVVASNGQSIVDGYGDNFSFTPVDNGIYTVTFTVTDKDGGVGSDQMVVTVLNVAPTADAGADRTVNEGSLVSLVGTRSDPGVLDTMTCLWQVVASNGQSVVDGHGDHFSFTPADNGTYTVYFTVTDKDGGSSVDTMVVTANNVAPTVNGGADKTVNEGSLVSLSAVGSDVSSVDTLSYLWHVVASNGQLIADKSGANFSFTALDNGTYTVTVKVMDDDGGFSTDSVLVTVNNVAPTVSMSGTAALVPGQAGSYSGSFSDVGVLDTQQVMWNFGDGSVVNWHSTRDAGAMNVSHSWDKKGSYQVTMSVRDKDGGVSSTTQTVTVESKGQIKKDPAAGQVLVVGGSNIMTFLLPTTRNAPTVMVAVDGKLQGVFNALSKIIAFDSNGVTRREITIGASMAGQVLANLATTKLDKIFAK